MPRPLPRILARIRATKEEEVARLLCARRLATLEKDAARRLESDPPRGFEAAVSRPSGLPNVIAEVKKASPSRGVIRRDFDPESIARAYEAGGAAALSCLTDEAYFQGSLSCLETVRMAAPLPVLRKDFLIHPAQVLESCAAGADAVLLIARMLDAGALAEMYALASSLSLGVLVEIHDEPDLDKALGVAPALIGVNNRDLDTFRVDVTTAFRMRACVPEAIPLVAESGIETREQVQALGQAGVAAVLVGEHLMRQPDPAAALRELRG